MTAITTRASYGLAEGATVTLDPDWKKGSRLTADGRIHRVLTINGKPCAAEVWVIGRTLVPA